MTEQSQIELNLFFVKRFFFQIQAEQDQRNPDDVFARGVFSVICFLLKLNIAEQQKKTIREWVGDCADYISAPFFRQNQLLTVDPLAMNLTEKDEIKAFSSLSDEQAREWLIEFAQRRLTS